MNVVLLCGRLTRDADVRTYGENNDKKMARYTLAVDRGGKREEGQQSADFIGCVCYGKNADFADNYLRQGMKIIIQGRIQTGSYTNKEGQKVYTTDIVVDRHEFCESKRNGDQSDQSSKPDAYDQMEAQAKANNDMPEFMNVPAGAEESLPW